MQEIIEIKSLARDMANNSHVPAKNWERYRTICEKLDKIEKGVAVSICDTCEFFKHRTCVADSCVFESESKI